VTLNYVLDVVSGRVEGSKDEYERRIKQLYKNRLNPDPEWWPDVTKEVRKKAALVFGQILENKEKTEKNPLILTQKNTKTL
jgi:hypothetical protein